MTLSASAALPETPDQLSPRVLSTILGSEVVDRAIQRIGQDEGFTGGGLFRIVPTYRAPSPDAPISVVAKVSPTETATRRALAAANRREVEFYQHVWRNTGLPVPKCWFARFDEQTAASLLILEDLGALRSVRFRDGCTAADATKVANALASLHAAFWGDTGLASFSRADILTEFDFRTVWSVYPETVAALLPGFALPPWFMDLCQVIADHDESLFGALRDVPPLTMVHRDMQIDNVMFTATGKDATAVLLDWQVMGRGRGANDLGYFVISSLEPECRRANEEALLKTYHDALVRHGVTDYSPEACRRDYLTAVLGKIHLTMIATVALDNSTPHKTAWRATDLTRLLLFCGDHELSAGKLAGLLAADSQADLTRVGRTP